MKTASLVVFLTAQLGLSACAYVQSVPIGSDNQNINGIRYNGERPIMIVNGAAHSIVYIKDPSKEYALRFGAFLAKNDMLVTLRENGTLASIKSNQDATSPVDGLLQIGNRIVESKFPLTTGTVANGSNGSKGAGGQVRVYDFVFDENGNLTNMREAKNIPIGKIAAKPVTVAPEKKEPDVTKTGDRS